MNTHANDSELIVAVENAVSALRVNKHDGFHGSDEDQEHFEIVLNTIIRDLEDAISIARGEL